MQTASENINNIWSNQIFTGGFVLLIIGAFFGYLQQLSVSILLLIFHQVTINVQIGKTEDAYRWMMKWMSKQNKALLSSRFSLVVDTKLSTNDYWKKMVGQEVISMEPPKVVYNPGPGLHILWYKRRIFFIFRTVTELQSQNGAGHEEHLNIVGLTGRKMVEDLINEAMNDCYAEDRGQTIIYTQDTNNSMFWARSASKPQRSLESVILDTNIGDELIADAKEFFNSADWYRAVGVPYRRSYLLYGKPGCGKTSFVAALAGKLNLNVCVLLLSSKNMNDQVVNSLLNSAPQGSIILLEDVDVAFPSREEKSKEENKQNFMENMFGYSNSSQVTFSGLLNAIDGIASQEGRLFIMTTNYFDRLDPALIRPGRVDRAIYFPLASTHQISRMFLKFYPKEEDLARQFADKIGEGRTSMAQLQGFFLSHKNDALAAYNAVQKFIKILEETEEAERKKAEDEEKEKKQDKKV